MLDAFYEKATRDEIIGHFFTKVTNLDIKTHIPIIADFWETILFGAHSYKKNAIAPHLAINQLSPMEEKHFAQWVNLFSQTIDSLFSGEKAELAKQRALSIATIMRIKTSNSRQVNTI